MSAAGLSWPRLDHAADKGTIETLHLLLQLIGKLPLRLHPWLNHGWHVALRMTPRGAITRSLPAGDRHFAVELDFREGAIRVECDNGSQSALPVAGRTIADAHRALANLLIDLGLPAPLRGGPRVLRETPSVGSAACLTPRRRPRSTSRRLSPTVCSRSRATISGIRAAVSRLAIPAMLIAAMGWPEVSSTATATARVPLTMPFGA